MWSRRQFLNGGLGAYAAVVLGSRAKAARAEPPLPPMRTITSGPAYHWFGYYDKLQFDPTGRFVLGMEVPFEHRSPKPDDEITIGMVDLADGDRWIPLGSSTAWNWQQGCMLQWLPGSKSQVLWNDRSAAGGFVCRLFDVESKQGRTVRHPVYAVSPDGRTAVAPDFRRLNDVRPGYGYCGPVDPYRGEPAPARSGIWRIDLETAKAELVIRLDQIAHFEGPIADGKGAKHWFNHLLFNTDGSRFVFLHRWRRAPAAGFRTRMLSARPDGSDLQIVDPSGHTSHFIWRDPRRVLAWTQPAGRPAGFYLLQDGSTLIEAVGAGIMTVNGHCTYLPGNEWILNDTYPDRQRLQHPYLFHVRSQRKVPLGHFHSPAEYTGEWRCDTHPRFSPDGKSVVIDSPHTGAGRQMHWIDIGGIVG